MSDDEIDGAALTAFATSAEKFAAMFDGFLKIAPQLRKIASLRNAVGEAQREVEKLRAEGKSIAESNAAAVTEAANVTRAAQASAADILGRAEITKSAADAYAKSMRDKADETADTANARAEGVVAAARADAARIVAESNGVVAAHGEAMTKAKAEIADAHAKLDERKKSVDTLAAQVAQFAKSIAPS